MMSPGTVTSFETSARVPRWAVALCVGAGVLWLAGHALQFLLQRSIDQRSGYENVSMLPLADQVRTAACALAIELAEYRSEHLSADALKSSPKPPIAVERPEVTQAFDTVLATIGNAPALPDGPKSTLREVVVNLLALRQEARAGFADLNAAVPGDGTIAMSISRLSVAETYARAAARHAEILSPRTQHHSCESSNS